MEDEKSKFRKKKKQLEKETDQMKSRKLYFVFLRSQQYLNVFSSFFLCLQHFKKSQL